MLPLSLLPIQKHRNAFLYLLEQKRVVIVVGQTGSGKTTQIPQFLHEAGYTENRQQIACTQPRRIAATSVAVHVALQMGVPLGSEVGYSIRFEDVTSDKTKIKYMTDGMLVREALVDPLLSRYSVIMIDEAHERSTYTDILLGLLKKILAKRSELKLVISSATMNAEAFRDYFNVDDPKQDVCSIMSIEGRMFPVDILYSKEPVTDYVASAIDTIIQIHTKEKQGDILVFLTGREEITTAVQTLSERIAVLHPSNRNIIPMAMYAGLSMSAQQQILDPDAEDQEYHQSNGRSTGTRRVLLSTNIAEASVTIPNIVYVIDSGFVKIRSYNPTSGIETLIRTYTPKSSAIQRAGRAGRVKPGKCFRLYPATAFETLPEQDSPEICRSNLMGVILQLKALGIDNVLRFPYFTAPPAEMMGKALELLFSLGALDGFGKLTDPIGLRMAELPLDPSLSRILLKSVELRCVDEMLIIAGMISAGDIFYVPTDGRKQADLAKRKFSVEEGDHLTLLNVYKAWEKQDKSSRFAKDNHLNFKSLQTAASVKSQLGRYLARFGMNIASTDSVSAAEVVRKCLLSGYFYQVAKMQPDMTFRNVRGDLVLWVHPTSIYFNRSCDWVMYSEVIETSGKIYMKDISAIQKSWLTEVAPQYYSSS